MTEQELSARLEECRQSESQRQAGDGGVYSMDEVLRELMAEYQPLAPFVGTAVAAQLVAC